MIEDGDERGTARGAAAVVVGVDGSAGAAQALRWALAEARLRNAPLRVVHAWTFGYVGPAASSYPYWLGASAAYTSLGADLSDLRRAAEALLERALADVADDLAGVEVEWKVVQGAAADVLVRAAGPDDLLVVGSRGHGGFVGLVLGSVSRHCVQHAQCPVVVVHVGDRAAAGTVRPASPERVPEAAA